MASTELRPGVKLVVLELLLDRPSWGYEVMARFERAFGEEPWKWSVSPQAIYDALNSLETQGRIEPIQTDAEAPLPPRSQRGSRQLFRVTADGARAIRAWHARPMPSNPSREELLIRLHFGEAGGALGDMLRLHAVACLEELERIAAAPAATRVQRLLKEDRRLAVQARLAWIEFSMAELRAPEDRPVRPVSEPH